MSPSDTAVLARLDAAGFIPSPGESDEEFLRRVGRSIDVHTEFERKLEAEGETAVFDDIHVCAADRIPSELFDEAAKITSARYGFAVRHVPGFFMSHSVGLLWGGCLIGDPDEGFSVFLIRDAFRAREKWLFYRRSELMAHELCHSARQTLMESTLDEYFAYQTSPSRLRRYLGNCFIHDRDAVIFIVPAVLLLAAQLVQQLLLPTLHVWPFWLAALAYPLWLLVRNQSSRNIVKKAEKNLRACRVASPEAVLFRCTLEELLELGAIDDRARLEDYAKRRAATQLRWRIIDYRFIDPPPAENTEPDHEADESCPANQQQEEDHGVL